MIAADAEDAAHCDSLTGATLGVAARSVPPSMPPRGRRLRLARACGYGCAGLALAAAVAESVRDSPVVTPSDAVQVAGQTVHFSQRFAARAGLRTVEVRESAFAPVIVGSGKTRCDPAEVASVGANALGTVRRVAKYEGDTVQRGELLAEIGSPLSARMEAAASLRASEAPPVRLGLSTVRSPLAGTVIERHIVTGQTVRGERLVFTVANLDRLWVDVSLDPAQARTVRLGDRVELSRGEPSGLDVAGSIAAFGAREGAPVLVHVAFDNPVHRLRLGQSLSARIFASGGGRAIFIPSRAVATIAGHTAVFVCDGPNSVSVAFVTLGGGNGDQTEVQGGLVPGQHIVSEGVGMLQDESSL